MNDDETRERLAKALAEYFGDSEHDGWVYDTAGGLVSAVEAIARERAAEELRAAGDGIEARSLCPADLWARADALTREATS